MSAAGSDVMVAAWPPSPHGAGRPGQCSAKAKATGLRCQRQAIAGGTVCTVHGGRSPQAKAKAAQRLAERDARTTLARLVPTDAAPVADVLGELARLCGELVAAREAAAGMVRELEGLTDHHGNAAPALALWLGLVDKSTRALEAAARLNLDERRSVLSQRYADLVADVLRAVVADVVRRVRAGDDLAAIEAAWPQVAAEHVRRLEASRGGEW